MDAVRMNIAILYPGEMGGSFARWILAKSNHAIYTNLDTPPRPSRTRELSLAAGVQLLSNDIELLRTCDIVISILRPDRAVETATRLADSAKGMHQSGDGDSIRTRVYLDLNAISPTSAKKIERAFANTITVIDGGIIGGPARDTFPSTVISGPADGVVFIEGALKDVIGDKLQVVGNEVGQASALKLSYASLTKGFHSLAFNSLLLARSHGVLDYLEGEINGSLHGFARTIERALGPAAAKAFRFQGEMEEISEAMGDAGLEGGKQIYAGAAMTYGLVKETEVGKESIEQAREKNRNWKEVIETIASAGDRQQTG